MRRFIFVITRRETKAIAVRKLREDIKNIDPEIQKKFRELHDANPVALPTEIPKWLKDLK